MKKIILLAGLFIAANTAVAKSPVDYVNPFIGTTNFGTTNPGAVVPNGMMSVVPFNVMGSENNKFDKDARWWSTPYEFHNKFFTGFSHVNLSGVGCPDLGSLLLMPTTGELNVNYKEYGSEYENESSSPGYYTNTLTKYGIKTEVTATERCGVARFTFPQGKGNILMNLGEGLTNESGAMLRWSGDNEIEGMKLLGNFCYNQEAVFPIYFVMKLSKSPSTKGSWKRQRPMTGAEAQWDVNQGKHKIYTNYSREIAGDDVGAWSSFNNDKSYTIEVQIGVSFCSIENARMNLESELGGKDFDAVRNEARNKWEDNLSRIMVEGGTEDQKTVFYTALYHALIHPNVINDVNGDYPKMESGKIMTTKGTRYTVFSLWDTYRNLHQLMTLVYPEKQIDMVNSMVDMYKEYGWMPRWELYGRETWTMAGDPAIPVIADTWLKGLRDFDMEAAYEGFLKSANMRGIEHEDNNEGQKPDSYYATRSGEFNRMRPDNNDYLDRGYIALRSKFDNSVSHALEYYIADYSLSLLAADLGKKRDAEYFHNRSLGYKNYYSTQSGTMRPRLADGTFLTPFNPLSGKDFEANPGFHEGSAWNYTFYVPHDIYGLAKLMGGKNNFVEKLEMVFDRNYYDPANEPDIAYPYLFSYFKGEEWRTQKHVRRLLEKYYTTAPDGIPGNDDTGTMSAWAIFSMMGFYPDCPGSPQYTLTSPVFDKVTIKLDKRYYPQGELIIEAPRSVPEAIYVNSIEIKNQKSNKYRISHDQLVNAGTIKFSLTQRK